MQRTEPISEILEARVEPALELGRGCVVVDTTFAARLHTRHTRRFEALLVTPDEAFTRDVPNVGESDLASLDERGLAIVGAAVRPGVLLVGKTEPRGAGPASPEEKLLRAIFGEAAGDVRDVSLRAPPGCFGEVVEAHLRANADGTAHVAEVVVAWERPLEVGDILLADGEPVAVAAIRSLDGDIAWSAERRSVSVAKAAMARDVLHARSIGPYDPSTQQPSSGRDANGGQYLTQAQLEVLAQSVPWVAWERANLASDAASGRTRAYEAIVRGDNPVVSPFVEAADSGGSAVASSDLFSLFQAPQAESPVSVSLVCAWLRALGIAVDPGRAAVGVSFLSAARIERESFGRVVTADAGARDGLGSQQIFGPLADYACACGKYARMKYRGTVCEACGVEVLASKVRRERFGHIELATPCRHPLLDEAITILLGHVSGTNARQLWDALERVDLESIDATETGPRAELASSLVDAGLTATDLMVTRVPVLPPDLRTPEIDARYRELLEHASSADEGQLQGALDRLFAAVVEHIDERLHPAMYAKTVDYSGVAHLVVDPSLDHGECRVPRAMLVELFKPWAYGILEQLGYVTTIKSAKRMVEAGADEALAAIEEASEGYPVLLAAGEVLLGRRVRAWDEPAIAVDLATYERLNAHVVSVHVPLLEEATLQLAALAEPPAARTTSSSGWLSGARGHGRLVQHAVRAGLTGDRDPLRDPVVAFAFGRPPEALAETELAAWHQAMQDRQEAIRAHAHEAAAAADETKRNPYLEHPVDALGLTPRTLEVLRAAQIGTIADLCRRTEAEMLKTRGIGRHQLRELKEILANMGLAFGID